MFPSTIGYLNILKLFVYIRFNTSFGNFSGINLTLGNVNY